MRASVFHAPGDVRVDNVPDSQIQAPTDALVRVTHACICGSDLWFTEGWMNGSQGGAQVTNGWELSKKLVRKFGR